MWSHTGTVHYSCKSSLKGTSVHSHQKIAGNNLVVELIYLAQIPGWSPSTDDSKFPSDPPGKSSALILPDLRPPCLSLNTGAEGGGGRRWILFLLSPEV